MPLKRKAKNTPKVSQKVYGSLGYPEQLPGLPDLEFLTELSPPEGLKKYHKMERNDPIVGGLLLHLKTIIHRLKFNVTGENADFVADQLKGIPGGIPGLIYEMASAFAFGLYIGEYVWKVDDSKIILKDVSPIWQPTIQSITNEVIDQQTDTEHFEIPYNKCLHFVPLPENRNPYGVSLLRHLYKPYYYKVSVEASESVGLDRDLTGLPVMTAPEGFDFTEADTTSPNYDAQVKQTLDWAVDIVSKVRRDQQQGIVKPFGWTFDIIRGENRTSVPTSEIISRYNTEMAAGVLQNFLSLGAFATTNNANTDTHIKNFLGICDSYGVGIADAINHGPIKKIIDYNGLVGYPKISFTPVNSEKLADLASFIARLVAQGVVTPTTGLEKELLQVADMPYDIENKKEIKE